MVRPVEKMLETWGKVIEVQSHLGEIQSKQMNSLIERTHKAVNERSDTNMWKGYTTVGVGLIAALVGGAGPYVQGWEAACKTISQVLPQTVTPLLQARYDSQMAPLSTEEQLNTGTRLPGAVEKGRSVTEARKEMAQAIHQLQQTIHDAMRKASSKN